MVRKITIIAGIMAILAGLYGTVSFIDGWVAKAADLKAVERRLDYKIENDKLMGMRERLWQLEKQYPVSSPKPDVVDKQIKELDSDLEMQKNKVKALEAK